MKYIITGGQKLKGQVKISGNKNSVFPCLAAAILTDEEVITQNIPNISDAEVFIEILKNIGADVNYFKGQVRINAKQVNGHLSEELMKKLRGSIVLVGALLGRLKKVSFYFPGGDVIGRRSINVHLEGFKGLGVEVTEKNGLFTLIKNNSSSRKEIFMKEASVTGTENMILFSVISDTTTIIKNCASEPHVVDLCLMLNKMGAKIKGFGTDTLIIEGVSKLGGTTFRINDDHIEIGTYAIACAITEGEVEIICDPEIEMDPMLLVLAEFGINLQKTKQGFKIEANNLRSVPKVVTNMWPGFPTDLMSAVIVLATQVKGITLCHDWMYESRMFFVDKLIAMGAHIAIADPHRVLVYGSTPLKGWEVDTPDIRAGMALVLAALVAEGQSVIHNAELIERGYAGVVEKLSKLGARIEK